MAEPTKAQLTGEITARLTRLEVLFEAFRSATEYRLADVETEHARERDDLKAEVRSLAAELRNVERSNQQAIATLTERLAAEEARGVASEKLADRSWGLAQAILVSVLSLLCGSVVTLLVQLAIK